MAVWQPELLVAEVKTQRGSMLSRMGTYAVLVPRNFV